MKRLVVLWQLIICSSLFAQDWQTAPEVWSKPIPFDSIAFYDKSLTLSNGVYAATYANSLDTFYYCGGPDVYRAVKVKKGLTDYEWRIDTLNKYINPPNYPYPKSCTISKDSKRLYFSGWSVNSGFGGWDLWMSDWNETKKDWGIANNLGPIVNSGGAELDLFELSKDSIYANRNSDLCLYVKDKQTEKWRRVDITWFYDLIGFSLTKNRKKLYFSSWNIGATTYNEFSKHWTDLFVCYWDEAKKQWGIWNYLNINSVGVMPDSINLPGSVVGGKDEHPWISDDGKVMLFTSTRNATYDTTRKYWDSRNKLYITYLLKDEKGNTVDVVLDDENNPVDIHLFPNYPNPFNGTTIISFQLPKREKIFLKVYDLLGKEITTLIQGEKDKGVHSFSFNPSSFSLSSGIYIFSLKTTSKQISKQMIYLK
ncbi:MAG: 5'-nucleotidase [Ignavibacteria bacterium]|nr:MAG: 5'-nucleotidase [Ignavibacteria bacterium]KAF0161808.1 MAG: 5'-nucleotidase [Ignavibacteria bacterium]